METIKSYLENMFIHMKKTPEVMRAKEELLTMMEDKYEELKAEGKTENEAIGIVISEFGNLEELAGTLGIKQEMNQQQKETDGIFLSKQDVKDYLQDMKASSVKIAIGVMMCILSPVILIILGGFNYDQKLNSKYMTMMLKKLLNIMIFTMMGNDL